MVLNATNINSIINDLLENNYSYADIGQIFTYGLRTKQRDIIAFHKNIEPERIRNVQKETMRRMKSYLLQVKFEDDKKEIHSYELKSNLNNNSLLGIINMIVEDNGEQSFGDVGEAIHQGSKNYLKKNPLAKNTNYKQFLEYKAIQSELQNLL